MQTSYVYATLYFHFIQTPLGVEMSIVEVRKCDFSNANFGLEITPLTNLRRNAATLKHKVFNISSRERIF